MRQFGEILGLSMGLQESREAKTILEFLRERTDHRMERRKTLAERLGLKGMGCCGGIGASNMEEGDNSDADESGPAAAVVEVEVEVEAESVQEDNSEGDDCNLRAMNLADALAAERQYRSANENEAETPVRMSLMRLLEETDGEEKDGNDRVCCVCMGKNKGSAFIPCGHTFCRVCSRELWLNRGTCPLCNRQIIDILDIF